MQMRGEDSKIYSLETGGLLDLPDDLLRDRGDVDIVPHDLHTTLKATSRAVSDTITEGRIPIVVGGDDSLLFACVRGFHDAVRGSVGVVHFDAHLDLMDENLRQGRFSQSSGMRRSLELPRVNVANSIQVGVRHFNFPSSHRFVQRVGLTELSAREFWQLGVERAMEKVRSQIEGADHVFFSFDIDAIDPAHAPGSGAFEPGGLTAREALESVRALAPFCEGFAVTEVNPMVDPSGMTATLAAYLVWYFAVFGAVGSR